ncbi:hypothetical protein BO86DRAFT_157086 [Aspergillus japonicus CBS 114.51]|uniref:Uncharacterized protein n=1 Tax=Aspergillus japonicus CBS 114.51 TaxID=1448312 RepID=A0A8T8WUU6_ASPJA|nr:hypothetical protein BO86DRAFT_157086 [Aspergillus japonicus CBS 114.51]RAH79222.1 hypothetical protein BO86DRAFT_157086 [Aspergillus japonicus CBS 114.51]
MTYVTLWLTCYLAVWFFTSSVIEAWRATLEDKRRHLMPEMAYLDWMADCTDETVNEMSNQPVGTHRCFTANSGRFSWS